MEQMTAGFEHRKQSVINSETSGPLPESEGGEGQCWTMLRLNWSRNRMLKPQDVEGTWHFRKKTDQNGCETQKAVASQAFK